MCVLSQTKTASCANLQLLYSKFKLTCVADITGGDGVLKDIKLNSKIRAYTLHSCF